MTSDKNPPGNLEVSRKVSIFADDMKREEVLSSIKALALKTLPPSSTLLLYGSRARGDNHKGSDWDLLILLDKTSLSSMITASAIPLGNWAGKSTRKSTRRYIPRKNGKAMSSPLSIRMLNMTKLCCYEYDRRGKSDLSALGI